MDHRARAAAPGAFLALSDGMTHFRWVGPEGGPLVVLVPGATLPLWVWNHLDHRLAAAGFRVLSYDLYGRGYSDRPRARYDEAFHLRQLSELLDRVAPDQSVQMIGLAFGVLIGARYAAANPERVHSLTAMGPDGFGVVMSKAFSSRLLGVPLLGGYLFSLIGTRLLMQRLTAYSKSRRVVEELEGLYRPTLDWKGFKRAVLSSVNHMPIHDATALYRDLSAHQIPVQIIFGRDDAVTPFPGEAKVRQAFPNGRLTVLEDVGHLPHYEQPERITAEIISFLHEARRSCGARAASAGRHQCA
jgi:pimeloyl-ACP methyl ester carboxylesterase